MNEDLPHKRTASASGINLLELADSPPEYALIVQLTLKKINASQAELWEEITQLPPDKQINRPTFESTLAALVESKWLWKTGEGENAIYSGRLKREQSHLHLSMDMSRKSGVVSTATWQMLEAKATIEADREKATGATPTIPRTFLPAKTVTGWFSGTRQIFIILLLLSAINFFAVASIDVMGVAGFVETMGVNNLPWISIAELIFGLVISAIYIQYADRIAGLRLMKLIVALLVGIYALIASLFLVAKYTHLLNGLANALHLADSTALLYPLLYIMRSQQIIIFPIAFWNLANNLYSMSDARRIFPMLASGEMLGGLIGYALFTEFFGGVALFTKENAFELLAFCGLLYLVILIVMQRRMKTPNEDENTPGESLFKNFKDGLETIQAVPLFRYLALTVALTWITLPILEYHFYASIETAPGAQTGNFENFYSLYSIGLMLLPLLFQWRIVPALTKRIEMRNAFIALPVALVIGSLALTLNAGLYLTALIVLVGFTIYSSWDSPMMNTIQYLVPMERRARVSALLNIYAYAFGRIFGSLILGLVLLAELSGPISGYIYLAVALIAALGGLATAIMVRITYEKSMLSWRIARRARSSSVLDKLSDL